MIKFEILWNPNYICVRHHKNQGKRINLCMPAIQKAFDIISLTCSLAPIPIKMEATKPRETAARSLNERRKAYVTVLSPVFRMAIETSRPASRPTKHQVVLIGIFECILKTNKTMAKRRSTSVASGISFTLDFSSTILWIFSPPWYNIIPRPKNIIMQTATSSWILRALGKNIAKLLMSCWSQTDQRIPVVVHWIGFQKADGDARVLSQ